MPSDLPARGKGSIPSDRPVRGMGRSPSDRPVLIIGKRPSERPVLGMGSIPRASDLPARGRGRSPSDLRVLQEERPALGRGKSCLLFIFDMFSFSSLLLRSLFLVFVVSGGEESSKQDATIW